MSNSIRADIMQMLKNKFNSLSFWPRMEAEIALKCAELPEPNTPENKSSFIRQLEALKDFLIDQDIKKSDLKFINEEIKLHKNTRMISLYEEKDDALDQEIIDGYSRLGKGSEGVVAISQPYNYAQLSKLSEGVYQNTGLVKFYISTEKTIYGKINAEIYEHQQDIPIATVVQDIKVNKLTEEKDRHIRLFGQRVNQRSVEIIKEINLPFYVYRFITEDNRDMILFTSTPCEIGDYVITGVMTECTDNKILTDSARLTTKLPFFFAQTIKNRIIKFKNHQQFKERLDVLGINKENFFDYPFSISKNKRVWKLKQPVWYKWLIWAWLTHEGKGVFNKYPLHIMHIGPKMSGKSLLLNCLHQKSKETRSIFSGSSSTLKSLVPSFKYNPAKLGYLAEANRQAFCDEFLRCLINTRSPKDGGQREESVAMMNDLLEHQKREAGSGVSRVNVNMTSRIFATTNPIRDIKNVENLIHSFDGSFLSRWLIYYQTEEHVQLIRKSRDKDLEEYNFKISINDWVSILDYLQTFSAKYDSQKIEEIHKSVPKILSENLNKHYDARHMHHIECLIDGIIKTRCILEKDMTFKATEKDYEILKEVWLNIIRSWLNPEQIKHIDIGERIFYLPENSQFLYWKICAEKRILSREKIEEIAIKGMTRSEYYEAFSILTNMRLILENDGFARPHYMKEGQQVF